MANGNYTFQDVQVLANGTVSVTQNTFAITPNSHPELGLTPFRACGSKIFEPPYYSNHLIELVHRCLAWDPADRPTPEQVMAIVNPIITGYGDRTPIQ
jgi:hypothetical protein